jgi:hypothetical protein
VSAAAAQLLEAPAPVGQSPAPAPAPVAPAPAPAAPPAEDPAEPPVHPSDQVPSSEPTLSLLLAASEAARVARATPATAAPGPNVFSPAVVEVRDAFLSSLSTFVAMAARLVRSLRTGSARW